MGIRCPTHVHSIFNKCRIHIVGLDPDHLVILDQANKRYTIVIIKTLFESNSKKY